MAKKQSSPTPARTTPEDLGFQAHKVAASHFEVPAGLTLADAILAGGVRVGQTMRRPGERADQEHVFRELMLAAGVDVAAPVHCHDHTPKADPVAFHFVDHSPDGRMVWGCLEERLTDRIVFSMLCIGHMRPGDTLWVYGDAVSEEDAAVIGKVLDLRLC